MQLNLLQCDVCRCEGRTEDGPPPGWSNRLPPLGWLDRLRAEIGASRLLPF